MRLPNASDLNEEQEQVYLYAPEDGRVLVSGPPGTGKTVMAVLRGVEAARKGRRVVVAMFNRMLEAYSACLPGNLGTLESQGVTVTTVRQLFRRLWLELRLPPAEGAEAVLLDVPFAEKDEAKALGARWQPGVWAPWGPQAGKSAGRCWVVDGDLYRASPDAFARWRPASQLPAGEESEFEVDWDAATLHIVRNQAKVDWSGLRFNKLIIDEGQDFPPAFYRLLRLLSEGILGPDGRPLSVMVLADENQRLNFVQHSTIAEIERELGITPDRHYRLTTNFRNTRPIARVARHFFAGASTGVPALPERTGPVPELRRCNNFYAAVEQILIYQRNNPRHEVGVLIPDDDKVRRRYFDALRKSAPEGTRVQTYAFRDPEFNQPRKHLVFDQPAVTVLNRASCKGLEFDAVFIVGLHAVQIQEGKQDFFRMGMYVMTARARRSLHLLWIGSAEAPPRVLSLMPDEPEIRKVE